MATNETVRLIIEGDGSGAVEALGSVGQSIGLNLAPLAGGALVAGAVAGVAAIGGAALNMSQEFDGAMNTFSARTGTAADDLGAFRDVATDIFTNNWGDSLGDVADAMATVQTITGAGADEIEGLTTRALIMRDVFDTDVNESVLAAQALMSEFGLSGEQAMDFITTGMQRGLNSSGDFLDSIGEYSNLFSDAGFSAEQMFGVMESGQAAGVLGTDKISDAVKEFGIITSEMGEGARQAFSDLGYDIDPLMAMLQDGSMTTAELFGMVAEDVQKIEDPLMRAQVQTALFGTMAEDLGVSFTDGLTTATVALQDMEGATMAAGDTVSQGLGPAWEGFTRTVSTALLPLGDALGQMLIGLTPHLAALGEWLGVNIPIAIETLRALWEANWPIIQTAIQTVWEYVQPNILEPLGVWFQEKIPLALETLRAIWEEVWPVVRDTIQAVWDFVQPNIFEPLGQWLGEKIPVALEALRAFWVDTAWPAIKASVNTSWEGFKASLIKIQEFFEMLPGLIDVGKQAWTATWTAISSAVQAAQAVLQPIFDAIKDFANWLSGISFDFNFNIPDIPDWMIPGSPIPLHTRWKDFGDYLDRQTFTPQFDTSQAEPVFAAANPGNFSGAGFSQPQNSTFAPSGGGGNQIVVNIYDDSAAALLLNYLEGAN